MDNKEQPIFISPKQAAKLLGIGEKRIYDLCHNPEQTEPPFPVTKEGTHHKIHRPRLLEWAEKQVPTSA